MRSQGERDAAARGTVLLVGAVRARKPVVAELLSRRAGARRIRRTQFGKTVANGIGRAASRIRTRRVIRRPSEAGPRRARAIVVAPRRRIKTDTNLERIVARALDRRIRLPPARVRVAIVIIKARRVDRGGEHCAPHPVQHALGRLPIPVREHLARRRDEPQGTAQQLHRNPVRLRLHHVDHIVADLGDQVLRITNRVRLGHHGQHLHHQRRHHVVLQRLVRMREVVEERARDRHHRGQHRHQREQHGLQDVPQHARDRRRQLRRRRRRGLREHREGQDAAHEPAVHRDRRAAHRGVVRRALVHRAPVLARAVLALQRLHPHHVHVRRHVEPRAPQKLPRGLGSRVVARGAQLRHRALERAGRDQRARGDADERARLVAAVRGLVAPRLAVRAHDVARRVHARDDLGVHQRVDHLVHVVHAPYLGQHRDEAAEARLHRLRVRAHLITIRARDIVRKRRVLEFAKSSPRVAQRRLLLGRQRFKLGSPIVAPRWCRRCRARLPRHQTREADTQRLRARQRRRRHGKRRVAAAERHIAVRGRVRREAHAASRNARDVLERVLPTLDRVECILRDA